MCCTVGCSCSGQTTVGTATLGRCRRKAGNVVASRAMRHSTVVTTLDVDDCRSAALGPVPAFAHACSFALARPPRLSTVLCCVVPMNRCRLPADIQDSITAALLCASRAVHTRCGDRQATNAPGNQVERWNHTTRRHWNEGDSVAVQSRCTAVNVLAVRATCMGCCVRSFTTTIHGTVTTTLHPLLRCQPETWLPRVLQSHAWQWWVVSSVRSDGVFRHSAMQPDHSGEQAQAAFKKFITL